MMPKVLIVYDSVSGSAEDVARAVAETLAKRGMKAVVTSVAGCGQKGGGLTGYNAVVAGCPLRLGRPTGRMGRFLREHGEALGKMPFAMFFTCLTIPQEDGLAAPTLPVFTDPSLSGVNRAPARLNFWEYAHTPFYTAKRLARQHKGIKPESVAFLNGRLDFSKLTAWKKLFMLAEMVMMENIKEGDFVNRATAAGWAKNLFARLL